MRAEHRSPAQGAGQPGTRAAYPLVRVYRTSPSPYQLPMDGVASLSGLPPELVSRFVALGLVDAERDARGRLWFRTSAPSAIARVQRLRTGLCLNYAAIGVVLDLLDRIERLEAALRHSERAAKEPTTWT
ncbi:chaperone modulator CbpM [Streptomyces sp. NBC_01020]|uniref:chaperone modulator CbpM n=1 Tax=unclassified Streptomyces TaxID=2593676 RepID=UPI002E204E8E|nr:chaperone modulator CbpM [Streptomyces sp. NBC_01020]WSX65228.1 chaperone modulator CbpM [Streptomyces sp. NBC_00932]